MKSVFSSCALSLLLFGAGALAATPRLDDYAHGVRVDNFSDRPLIEVTLPDSAYQAVTRADLGDVRVFNADGAPVPHAFCASPAAAEPTIALESLPVFDLQAAPSNESGGTRVDVETAGGTQVRIQEGEATAGEQTTTRTWAHVIDARAVTDELRSIEFDWHSPDGASQANVRIEASDDLDRWRTVVAASTLLRVAQGGQQLQRKSVPLPQQRYQYLRVARTDGGPPLQVAEVIAERVAQPTAIEPVWFAANPLASSEPAELLFDAARIAPVSYARLVLPQDNSSVRVRVHSRDDEKSDWRERWSGEVYSIVTDGERRLSPPAEFSADHDRYWRVQYAKQSDVLNPTPTLELGYRPVRLRFLAQGSGPFTVAFGSRRADAAPARQCGSLLADVRAEDLEQMIGEATLGPQQTLGGATALKPLPRQTPVRLIVLWGVLIVGVGLLVAMAISLFKRINTGQS